MCTNILKEWAISINFLLNISINQNTRRHNQKIAIFYIHRRENLNLKNCNLESVLAIVHRLSVSKKISDTE
jgi:hypothetical protein